MFTSGSNVIISEIDVYFGGGVFFNIHSTVVLHVSVSNVWAPWVLPYFLVTTVTRIWFDLKQRDHIEKRLLDPKLAGLVLRHFCALDPPLSAIDVLWTPSVCHFCALEPHCL